MKFINDFMEKKTQDALREANEHLERKARLSELESRNKQKRNMLLHPLKSADERKEIKNLKKEIAEYEKKKEDRVSLIVLGGLFVGFMLLLSLSALFHKPSDENPKADEAIVAETTVDSKTESALKGITDVESVATSDEQSSTAQSTVIPIVADASEEAEIDENADQAKTELDKDSSLSEMPIQGIMSSDLRIKYERDYAHVSNDMIYLGNDEGATLTIETNNKNMEVEDLIIDYDTSLLNVDISDPIHKDGTTTITAYVTANEVCNTELFITTEFELESSNSDTVTGYPITIKKLDSLDGRVAFVTPTGTKYHFSADCAGENAIRTTYYDVAALEYEPCGNCVN